MRTIAGHLGAAAGVDRRRNDDHALRCPNPARDKRAGHDTAQVGRVVARTVVERAHRAPVAEAREHGDLVAARAASVRGAAATRSRATTAGRGAATARGRAASALAADAEARLPVPPAFLCCAGTTLAGTGAGTSSHDVSRSFGEGRRSAGYMSPAPKSAGGLGAGSACAEGCGGAIGGGAGGASGLAQAPCACCCAERAACAC